MPYRSNHHRSLAFHVAARTHVGLCRHENEDVFAIAVPGARTIYGPPFARASLTSRALICGVFDGSGLSATGEVFSRIVAHDIEETLPPDWSSASCEGLRGLLVPLLSRISQSLFSYPSENPKWRGMIMVATLVAAVDNHLQLVHEGDTRAYLLRDQRLQQISTDHTLLALLLAEGRIEPEEAASSPYKNMVVRALGTKHPVNAETLSVEVQSGDLVLLCSAGVHRMLDDARIQAILVAAEAPEAACDALIEAAEGAGGQADETVVVLSVRGAE